MSVGFFQMFFSSLLEWHSSLIVSMENYIDFVNDEPVLHSWDESSLVVMFYPLYMVLNLIC